MEIKPEDVKMMESEMDLLARYGNPFIAKAICDTFEYTIGLRSGHVVECRQLDECPASGYKWLFVSSTSLVSVLDSAGDVELGSGRVPCFARGIYIRVDDIVWIADAPCGS